MSNHDEPQIQPLIHYDEQQRKLTIHNAGELPEAAFKYADQVEILDMANNHLTSLPNDIARFNNVQVAFFSGNNFQEVPRSLAGCKNLQMVGLKSCTITSFPDDALPSSIRGVILTDNKLTTLPESIGQYTQLQKLMLSGNQLAKLPKSILECQNLELLRVAANNLQESPDWIARLPNLAWYADAGNPFSNSSGVGTRSTREYMPEDIVLGEEIGRSAMNVVYAAQTHAGLDVAVKIFGSGITTDGLPDDDIAACLTAGYHPNIIGGLGRYTDKATGKSGLVMPRVSKDYRALGHPPSLTTLTRDIYAHNSNSNFDTIRSIIRDVAQAMAHMHARGVMHGDLYAHNIHTNDAGHSIVGDFGAASLYNPSSSQSSWRERVDIRALGHLIEELAEQVEGAPNILHSLARACVAPNLQERPLFADICQALDS